MNSEIFKILSIDGGGIRGIFPARFLVELEADLKKKEGQDKRLCDYFDLICGTSTGGIIALAIALGIPASNILSLYKNNAKAIFFGKPSVLKYLWKPKYDNEFLRDLLKRTFDKIQPGGTRLGHCLTRVCIPTLNGEKGKAVVYKTPHHKDLTRDYQIPVHHVAMSTASAPVFFKPYSFSYKHKQETNEHWVTNNMDGGLIANNPTLIGILEAHCGLNFPLNQLKVLSLGTGHLTLSERSPNEKFGLLHWFNKKMPLLEMMFSAQSQNVDNMVKYLNEGIGQEAKSSFYYKRIQHQFDEKTEIKMDETSDDKLKELEKISLKEYQEHNAQIIKEFLSSTKLPYTPLKKL